MGGARRRLENYFNRLWYRRRVAPAPWRALSRVYAVLAGPGQRPGARPPRPVIVVGNLTVGGGGKTPVVSALCGILEDAGFSAAIISRGYGARSGKMPRRIGPDSDPARDGDEPVLLARATGCPVWVCRRRDAALEAAVAGGADVVVSDDGLQNRSLPRSFEICVIDAARGFGNRQLLPAGPLRQPMRRLDDVDVVLCKGPAGKFGPGDLPGLPFELLVEGFAELGAARWHAPDHLAGREVDAVCGIANPESFFDTLENLGLSVRRHAFADHHAYRTADLSGLAGPLVVTEKDAVKLERLENLPETWVLRIRAGLPDQATFMVLEHVRDFENR